jgi:hypothetical protein
MPDDTPRVAVEGPTPTTPSLELFDLLSPPPWHADAACKEAPADISWFPDRHRPSVPAKAICSCCLALQECRAWALAQGPALQGIWGGLTRRERRRAGRTAA